MKFVGPIVLDPRSIFSTLCGKASQKFCQVRRTAHFQLNSQSMIIDCLNLGVVLSRQDDIIEDPSISMCMGDVDSSEQNLFKNIEQYVVHQLIITFNRTKVQQYTTLGPPDQVHSDFTRAQSLFQDGGSSRISSIQLVLSTSTMINRDLDELHTELAYCMNCGI